jgi:hypothetical protein
LAVEAPDGGVVPNVEAFVVGAGSPNVQLNCMTAGMATFCDWFGVTSFDAGSYTIQVAAPGYQTANVPVTLSLAFTCGKCGNGVLTPDTVVLTPGDAGP